MSTTDSNRSIEEEEDLSSKCAGNQILNKKILRENTELKQPLKNKCFNGGKSSNNPHNDKKKINGGSEKEINPKNIQFIKDILNDSFYVGNELDNIFTVFTSYYYNIAYIIYTSYNKSIICYDLIENKKLIKIIQAHNKSITNFRHIADEINERDLILSLSNDDNNVKIWNFNNWQCILDLKNAYKIGKIYSSCFLNYKNNIYIIVSNNNNYLNYQPIKVFDLKGKEQKQINDSKDKTVFIDSYYDINSEKCYIISGGRGFIKSYDFHENKEYHRYSNKKNISIHMSIVIHKRNDIIELIESSNDGYIRIWNFHTGEVLKKIKVSHNRLYGICIWYDDFLLAGCKDKTIKLIDLKNEKNIKNLPGHNDRVFTIKKIILPVYGQCILSQSLLENQIKLWSIKRNNT